VLDADQLGQGRRQGREPRELVERRQAGQPGLRLGGDEGRPPEGHDRVADVLVDDPVVAADRLRHRRQVTVDDRDEPGRRRDLAERGEALHVAEQHGHHPALALRRGELRPLDEPLHDARVDVLAEGLLDLRLDLELGDHGVEGAGEQADLVP
jgi:hypothetical protein